MYKASLTCCVQATGTADKSIVRLGYDNACQRLLLPYYIQNTMHRYAEDPSSCTILSLSTKDCLRSYPFVHTVSAAFQVTKLYCMPVGISQCSPEVNCWSWWCWTTLLSSERHWIPAKTIHSAWRHYKVLWQADNWITISKSGLHNCKPFSKRHSCQSAGSPYK